MSDAKVAAHFEQYLGQGQRAEVLDRGAELWRYERPEFVSFATRGLSALPIAAVHPQELVCSVEHGQDGAAAFLVRALFEMSLENDRGPVDDQVIPNDKPLLAETDITGLLVSAHPYLDDEFNVLFGENRQVLAEVMTLIPLTSGETAHARTSGVESLLDALEANDPPLLDVTRR